MVDLPIPSFAYPNGGFLLHKMDSGDVLGSFLFFPTPVCGYAGKVQKMRVLWGFGEWKK